VEAAAIPTPVTTFDEVAFVQTPACSNDYSVVDNCHNYFNPPRPSLFREVSTPWRPYTPQGGTQTLQPSSVATSMLPFPPFEFRDDFALPQYSSVDGDQQVLPHHRGSNDGRLYIRGGCLGCAEGSTLYTVRPEVLGQDFRYEIAARGQHFLTPEKQFGLHPFTYINPLSTGLKIRNNGRFPDSLHSNICDSSSPAFALPTGRTRNPRACQARFEAASSPVSGDCYDLSLVYGLTENREPATDPDHWELRSVDLTVFVRNPKSVSAGSTVSPGGPANWGLWVYPRNPTGEVKTSTSWTLPPFRPFNVHESSWGDMNWNSTYVIPNTNQIDWVRLFTEKHDFKCYKWSAGVLVRDTTGPAWCQFFDRQSHRTRYQVEDDEDSVIGNGGYWNGIHRRPASGEEKPLFLFEPTTSGDGRLLIVNMDGLFYSYAANACRAADWAHFKPISMMPKDPAVNSRYELAKSQVIGGVPREFRDSMGRPIPFGVRNQGAYPWIDRDGKNLFFAAKNNPHDGYYARRVVANSTYSTATTTDTLYSPPGTDAQRALFNPDRSPAQYISVLGAWTHGKAVILDNGLNITDLGGNREGNFNRTYDLRLYQGNDLAVTPGGSSSIFSFENQLNLFDALRPTLPFDVVWTVQSNTQRNSEVAFDEYMHKQAFVVAHMNAPIRMDVSPFGAQRAETFPKDGFRPFRNVWAYVRGGDVADFRFAENPRVQNASTASALHGTEPLQVPDSLRLRGGARVEPVALGGVLGKGVWLDGANDFMDMGYPVQATRRDWYLGIWLDSRTGFPAPPASGTARTTPRTVFYFPDNSWLGLVAATDSLGNTSHELVAYNGATAGRYTVSLGRVITPSKYFHLGVKLFSSGGLRRLAVYVNGTFVSALAVAGADTGFDLMKDTVQGWTWMTVSDPGPSFTAGLPRLPFAGWVDEFRVYSLTAADVTAPWLDEHICNQALGTLVDIGYARGEVSHPALTSLRSRSAAYPNAPAQVCEQLRLETYSDPRDFPAQYGEHLCIDRVHKNPHLQPSWSFRCLRTGKLGLPALAAASPRPDSSANVFCLSCHTSAAPLPGLKVSALTGGSLARYQDPRRQPSNVPAVLGGIVPPWLTTSLNVGDGTQTLDHYFDHYRAP
jgi:hypothetical protein